MRHPIKASPRNNETSIIPRDDASRTNVAADWRTEAGLSVGKNGEQPGITPTHRYPVPRDQYLLPKDEKSRNQAGRRRRLTAFSITVIDSARRTASARVTPEPVATNQIVKPAQAVAVVAAVQPTAGVQGGPEAKRLVARASALLSQGDIGAARAMLERAVETGSAQASFMLAETYDPGIVSAWGDVWNAGRSEESA
jgi:hypothetical protein